MLAQSVPFDRLPDMTVLLSVVNQARILKRYIPFQHFGKAHMNYTPRPGEFQSGIKLLKWNLVFNAPVITAVLAWQNVVNPR